MAAVGVIWAFIRPFLSENTKGIDTDIFTIKMRIVEESVVWNQETRNVALKVGRDPGEADIAGFIVAVSDSQGRTFSQEENIALEEFDVVDVFVDYSSSGLNDEIVMIEIYPILLDNAKNELQGNVADRYTFRGDESGGGGGETCPDSQCLLGEECAADCGIEQYCDDSVDNDEDGRLDCNDNDCAGDSSCGFFVFVTSSIHQGNLGGISGAGDICKNLAESVPRLAGRNWEAVLE